ncbi:hypothetical protein [Streptomyces sp. NPDC006274]|uniref:hypothetical protein n=1 Tax=unclassified Streptomyces TaxID=2593676 RepID=UPI0033B4E221
MSETVLRLPLGEQARPLAVLADIAASNPGLPGAYMVFQSIGTADIRVQLEWPSELEIWRQALGVPVADVSIDRGRLRFTTHLHGVPVEVYAGAELTALAGGVA